MRKFDPYTIDFSSLTEEEKREVAGRMAVPIRCGGAHIRDGKWYYIFRGCELTEEQFRSLRGLTTEELSVRIKELEAEGVITYPPKNRGRHDR